MSDVVSQTQETITDLFSFTVTVWVPEVILSCCKAETAELVARELKVDPSQYCKLPPV